ncbi:ATP-dependent Clp protease ATP-binding subunit [Olleya aquimaris]|uniref:ATP-dependent Clp protease ATP-binding subunit n=1 Tax=Olleya sediminilitoris TaxID=2795739 RepID=A0ABS1WKB5_9FLAO|nr:ATP-dependent Clp protease ATP-binding subunit [Olleya sediminilitoris]AXO79621.1 ATP-dependent Clp protease ATP-binding subunit [Olleya aquimaris]MBL7559565.1 ATP-dependent Clp protease ATP-binding subunit [Olleya sediminilitoris]
MEYSLDQSLNQAIHIAQSIAKEYSHKEYSSAHLLKALLHKDIGMLKYLNSIDVDGYYIEEWAEVRLESYPKTNKIPEQPGHDAFVEAIFNEAETIKLKLGVEKVNAHCVLAALAIPGVGFSFEQLKTFPLQAEDVIKHSSKASSSNKTTKSGTQVKTAQNTSNRVIDYTINKTDLAKSNQLEIISGRDAELKMITEILGRRSKPNVIILGEPGVGKTVLLNGLTYTTLNTNIPEQLKDAEVYELDFISLVSGAGYKGEIEDRLKKVIDQVKAQDKAILLIDQLNVITDKTNNNQGLVNILKSELVKGELTIIATATNDAFRKHIEIDEGLSRQFETVTLEEPSAIEALRMIENTISYYTEHHNLDIDSETITEAIRLAKRYNKERSLPDSAIDLIDRTMSAAKFMIQTSVPEIETLKERVEALKAEKRPTDQAISEIKWMYTQMKDKLSYLLFTELEEENKLEHITTAAKGFKELNSILKNLSKVASKDKTHITKNDIALTIANKTGIPTGKLQADEKDRLLNMEDQLKKRVIGQDHAVKVITEAVLESRSGLSKPGLPIGSFFFSGPTGTGKTELAKALAEFLFQTETSIIRFDMSEFKEEHSAALLYGAPPGYVGYEEGGLLVNKIRQKPYSIVLFDEIEKAHPSVFDIFLQILDEGKLHDRLGKEGDFSNAVILFTSNIGSDHIVDTFNAGQIPKSNDLLEMMGKHFRPEFLGRLTEIIPFSPIMEDFITKIFKIQLKDLHKALDKQEMTLHLSDKATTHLAKKGFTPKYGARPLRGVIRKDLRSPLSKKIISGELTKGATIKLDIDKKGALTWDISNK